MSNRLTKPKSTRDLDLLTYAQKVLHWDRDDDPWRPHEGRYRFANPEGAKFSMKVNDGHVVAMRPLLVGRPCFGIPTAFLRYSTAMKFLPGRGAVPASRCHSCKLFDRCNRLVRRRLERGHEEIKTSHMEWLLAGGTAGFREPKWREAKVGRRWRDLVRALVRHPFESSNDAALVEHYARVDDERLEEDRRRKRRERKCNLKAGSADSQHLRDLKLAANRRLKRVVAAVNHARKNNGPKRLRQLSRESLEDLRNVWMGRQLLILQGKVSQASKIARWIVDNGYRNESENLNALSTRVRRDLARIRRFERLDFEHEKLIAPFDAATELS